MNYEQQHHHPKQQHHRSTAQGIQRPRLPSGMNALFFRHNRGRKSSSSTDTAPDSITADNISDRSWSLQPTTLNSSNKKRRSLSPGRDEQTFRDSMSDNSKASKTPSFFPLYNFDNQLDSSNNFVFDDTINEGQQEQHPLPSLDWEQQHSEHPSSLKDALSQQYGHRPVITATEQEEDDNVLAGSTKEGDYELNVDKERYELSLDDDCCPQNQDQDQDNGERDIILYLIRHGEAAHNIKEKEAKTRAKRISVRQGLAEDDPVTLERMEDARKSVLNDEKLRDAPLSSKGRDEAQLAHERLQQIITDRPDFQRPSYVMVSPLTRTLETCDIIFPNHDEIHVRTSISERRTMKPPDTRSHVSQLSKRRSFRNFSMEQLRAESMMNISDELLERSQHKATTTTTTTTSMPTTSPKQEVLFLSEAADKDCLWGASSKRWKEEDRAELRRRTEEIFVLLAEANSNSVAVVTHKGYLRELERGPFDNPTAMEFTNCEIRVYKVTVSLKELKLVKSERLV